MISERKKNLLEIIIKEYVQTATPVSSGSLVEKYKLAFSPATVRNEMMELEEEGYIYQPHTSAGRTPTEKAYKYFLLDLLKAKRKHLKDSEKKTLDLVFAHDESSYKKTAKAIAEISNLAVFWAFHKNDLYYTGLSNLFSQPEFKQLDMVHDFSEVIDRLEEIIDESFESLKDGEQVFIGGENPFGNFLSTALLKYKKDKQTGVFGIIGPIRMDYEKNLMLLNFIKDKFIK